MAATVIASITRTGGRGVSALNDRKDGLRQRRGAPKKRQPLESTTTGDNTSNVAAACSDQRLRSEASPSLSSSPSITAKKYNVNPTLPFSSSGGWAVLGAKNTTQDQDIQRYPNYADDLLRTDRHFRIVSAAGFLCWLLLLTISYLTCPVENLERLDGTERSACFMAGVCLLLGITLRTMSFLYNRGPLQGSLSGVIIGAMTVQFIAVTTEFIMAFAVTPVMIDPVTGGRVHLLRWSEWTPLAFIMTFLVEGVDVPTPEYGLSIAYLNAFCQGLSTICGLFFPFCPEWISWSVVMFISCILYLFLFPRLYYKVKSFSTLNPGTTLNEIEIYERAKLSLQLLVTCVVTWTVLVTVYFVFNVYPMFAADNSMWKDPAIPMIGEAGMDVIAKVVFMFIIVDIHDSVFDQGGRTRRKLEELRQMMNAVWENSSDVLAISVKGFNGNVTTMISPTFLYMLKRIPERNFGKKGERPFESRALVFEYGQEYIMGVASGGGPSRSRPKGSKPKLYDVDLSGISLRPRHQSSSPNKLMDEILMRITDEEMLAMAELVSRGWRCEDRDSLTTCDLLRVHGEGQQRIQCEAKITRLDDTAIVIVVRDVSERFKRFEAEKRVVSEMTARQKDAEANKFTRHEVKNGLLAAIGLCDSLRDTSLNAIRNSIESDGTVVEGKLAMVQSDISRSITELDISLHEILDTILAEAMARDVIHEVYLPKLERVDFVQVLKNSRGFMDRFPIITTPDPLPLFHFDPQLLKYIHRNAVSNACKYGKKGGLVSTEINFDPLRQIIEMRVINLPGDRYEEILALGPKANEIVFLPGQRLQQHAETNKARKRGEITHSTGDGAWIMQKCARTFNGECFIDFQPTRTVFSLRCPATPFDVALKAQTSLDPSKFQLPENTWGIGIDDSKMQRKLLERMFKMVGVNEKRTIVLGKDAEEIWGFTDFVVNFVEQHPEDFFFLMVDENLDVDDDSTKHSTVSGSQCVQTIRHRLISEHERRMLALVRSANDSSHDIAVYNSRAHGFLPKVPLKKERVLEMIVPLWEKRYARHIPETDTVRRGSCESSCGSDGGIMDEGEIVEVVTEIDKILMPPNDPKEKWFLIWEKLHTLKGDILTSFEDVSAVATAVGMIDSMRGLALPDSFTERWQELRKLVLFHAK